MAQSSTQSQLPPQRPQFSPPQPQPRDFPMPNGRSTSFAGPSPSIHGNYGSPSSQQYSPTYALAPPSKRQRLSPDAPSPFSNTHFSQAGTTHAQSPITGNIANGTPTASSRPGLMAPPQRPVEKDGPDRSYDDILAGTGVDLEEEARSLARPDYYSQPNSSFQTNGSFGSYQTNSFGQPNGSNDTSFGNNNQSQSTPVDREARVKRENERSDWEAARHSQHALWDMFLQGGTINDKVKKYSHEERLVEAQAGVLVNTQRNAPPPKVRVNGLEGASRVIDQGQSILDTKDKADRLSEAIKLVSLAAKARLTGLINTSAKLALERREHSKGNVPEEWADIAVAVKSNLDGVPNASSPTGSTSLKRTFSQANSDSLAPQANPAEQVFDQFLQVARTAEDARLLKRQTRKAKSTGDKDGDMSAEAAEALAAAMDPEKKTTKKERKAAESKFSEQQQHKNANDAARMATSSIIGRTFGKKGKSYSWMTGGPGAGPGSSTPSTPGKAIGTSTAGTPTVGVVVAERGPVVPRGRRFQAFDEDEDSKVQARDILLVLESDSQAARTFVKGHSSLIEGKEG